MLKVSAYHLPATLTDTFSEAAFTVEHAYSRMKNESQPPRATKLLSGFQALPLATPVATHALLASANSISFPALNADTQGTLLSYWLIGVPPA